MFTLEEFGELRHLWLKYNIELKRCYIWAERDGRRVPDDFDPMRTRRCHNRAIAVEHALRCLSATHPETIFYTFVCPTINRQYTKILS